ncbi:MAG: MarR family transcriptional regulator [Candidatus Thermoplasmatota archaeon]|nr:MarR family transcriptional regulator [Candidatus Thermoplasmatota archaeon]
MLVRRNRARSSEVSKTERIADIFMKHPLDRISPKEISRELNMDIQLVTSIVNRLRSEGLIERVSRGKYRLRMEQTIADEVILRVSEDYLEMSSEVLPAIRTRLEHQLSAREGKPLDRMVRMYAEVKKFGGDLMARNLLRLAASKSVEPEGVKVLISAVGDRALHSSDQVSSSEVRGGPSK